VLPYFEALNFTQPHTSVASSATACSDESPVAAVARLRRARPCELAEAHRCGTDAREYQKQTERDGFSRGPKGLVSRAWPPDPECGASRWLHQQKAALKFQSAVRSLLGQTPTITLQAEFSMRLLWIWSAARLRACWRVHPRTTACEPSRRLPLRGGLHPFSYNSSSPGFRSRALSTTQRPLRGPCGPSAESC